MRVLNKNCLSMLPSLLVIMFATNSAFAQKFVNIAYVEVNSNALSNVGCYALSETNTPFFNIAVIFAANIVKGDDGKNPQLFLNPNVKGLLDKADQVKELQSKGIKVVLSILGGWPYLSEPGAARRFAVTVAAAAQQYDLDGIDIDDEYNDRIFNKDKSFLKYEPSMVEFAEALVNNPGFKGKTLSKALFRDEQVFKAKNGTHKLADFLNYGSEMSYGDPNASDRLNRYLPFGMTKNALLIGGRADEPGLGQLAAYVKDNGFGGVMVYNITKDSGPSLPVLSQIARVQSNQFVNIDTSCLR